MTCCVDLAALQKRMKTSHITVEELARDAGLDRSTLYRRMKTGKLRIGDVHAICSTLKLTKEEAVDIFLSEQSQ